MGHIVFVSDIFSFYFDLLVSDIHFLLSILAFTENMVRMDNAIVVVAEDSTNTFVVLSAEPHLARNHRPQAVS